jgi:hypothetical protein
MTDKKAQAYRKANKAKEIRLVKGASARRAIGRIEHDMDIFVLTFGQFSLIDAMCAILDQTGAADVVISTWTAGHAHLDRAEDMMAQADIKSMRMIVDTSFQTRQPKYYDHMISLFGIESIRTMRTHAKYMTITNDEWNIVVRTSMNMNENPRLENIEISDHAGMAGFFKAIVDDIFSSVDVGEIDFDKVQDQVDLDSVDDFCDAVTVRGDMIPGNTLHEIECLGV